MRPSRGNGSISSPGPLLARPLEDTETASLSAAPSQLETWDYKPGLAERFDQDLPESVRGGQVLTGMTASQTRFPVAPSIFKFQQYGKAGHWVSDLFPHTAKVADEFAVMCSLHTVAGTCGCRA